MIITPIAASVTATLPGSEWRCHSRFRQAINLQNRMGKFITLHRGPGSLSPMGWILGGKDFDQLAPCLSPGTLCTSSEHALHGDEFMIKSPRRRITLAVPELPLDAALPLKSSHYPTGLCGNLSEAVNTNPPIRIKIEDELNGWLAGTPPDWRSIIGLGPGLTPSADDMLTGVMAVLYASPAFSGRMRKMPLLPAMLNLNALTTDISAHYLCLANKGLFSSLIIQVLRHMSRPLASPTLLDNAVFRLLQHGHTSGADTLSGMIYALQWRTAHRTGV